MQTGTRTANMLQPLSPQACFVKVREKHKFKEKMQDLGVCVRRSSFLSLALSPPHKQECQNLKQPGECP